MIKAPQLLKWQSGRKVEPVVISIVDLKSNSGRTPAGPALAFLKKFGLDVALDNGGFQLLDLIITELKSYMTC